MSFPHSLLTPLLTVLAVLAVLATMALAHAGFPTEGTIRVFLVAGQSNAEGADTHVPEVDLLPSYVGAAEPQTDVRFWYENGAPPFSSGGWIPLQPELQRQIFGPELTFASRVKGALSDPIAIIKSTRGGSTLAVDWDPGNANGFQLYARTLTLVQTALAALTAEGLSWRFEGVLWHQGENDMLNNGYVAQYEANLAALIAQLRTDLELPALPWHIGATSDKCIWGMDFRHNMQVLRSQQLAVVAADPLVHFVPTSHLSFAMNTGQIQPHYHFGSEGQLQLGEAYADSYLGSIGIDVAHQSEPFCCGFPAQPGSKVRVFVLAGQRSMEGERAYVQEIADHPEFATLGDPQQGVAYRYRLGGDAHTSTDWAPLGPTDGLGNFGPELSFGQVLDGRSDDPIAVIRITHSAAVIADWLPNPTDASLPQYDDAIAFIQDALSDLVSKGLDPVLEAVVWVPGEHDAWWNPFLQGYATNLASLVAAMRSDLGAPDLKWLVAELADGLIWDTAKLDQLDGKIQTVASADPLLWFVSTDAITVPPLSPTFATEGTLELGKRLAEFYLGLAQAIPYGSGKAGTQGEPVLSASAPPVLGTSLGLDVQNGNPGDSPILFLGLAPLSLPFDGGALLVTVDWSLWMAPITPTGSSSLVTLLPNSPALVGVSLYLQAMFVDSGGAATGPHQSAQTQGLELRFGE